MTTAAGATNAECQRDFDTNRLALETIAVETKSPCHATAASPESGEHLLSLNEAACRCLEAIQADS